MKTLKQIIVKNLKLLIRSRTSALIIILAPLLVILLVGIAFDNANLFGLKIGIHSENFDGEIEGFLSQLAEKEFKIVKYEEKGPCIEDIKLGMINTCVFFPGNLNTSNSQKEITFYVDYSKINLVWMIMDTLSTRFGSRSTDISKNLTSVLIDKLELAREQLEAKQPVVASIKTRTGEVSASVSKVTEDLTALDLSYNPADFPIGEIKTKFATVKNSITTNLDSAEDDIGDSLDYTNESSITTPLNSALDSIGSAKTNVNSNSLTSLTTIAQDLTLLQTKVKNTEDQLTQAKSVRDSSLPSFETSKNVMGQNTKDLQAVYDSLEQVVKNIEAIQVTDPEAIAQPFVTKIKPVNSQSTYLNYLFPSLIILVIMFISILLGTTLVMMEKHSPAYFRNFITPTRNIVFVTATYLTNIILVFVQMLIILLIALYFFSTQLLPSLPLALVILLMAATFFSLLGMIIGYLFNSEETGILAAISSGSICLFLSSVIIPVESMSPVIRNIVGFNPFVVAERVLREVILFQPKLIHVIDDIALLLLYSALLFGAIWGMHQFISKHYVEKFTYHHHKRKRAEMKEREKNPKPKKKVSLNMFSLKKEMSMEEKIALRKKLFNKIDKLNEEIKLEK